MSRRIKESTIKKYAKNIGAVGIPIIFLMFMLLASREDITIISYSNDTVCAGTINYPCYAYINFTANTDIFIYPINNTWMLNTNKQMKKIEMQRAWGNGWRNIDLTKGCTGSWCGCYWCTKHKTAKFSYVFRKDKNYSIRFVGYKNNPFENIKWGFGNIDPEWLGILTVNFSIDKTISKQSVYFNITNKQINYDNFTVVYGFNETDFPSFMIKNKKLYKLDNMSYMEYQTICNPYDENVNMTLVSHSNCSSYPVATTKMQWNATDGVNISFAGGEKKRFKLTFNAPILHKFTGWGSKGLAYINITSQNGGATQSFSDKIHSSYWDERWGQQININITNPSDNNYDFPIEYKVKIDTSGGVPYPITFYNLYTGDVEFTGYTNLTAENMTNEFRLVNTDTEAEIDSQVDNEYKTGSEQTFEITFFDVIPAGVTKNYSIYYNNTGASKPNYDSDITGKTTGNMENSYVKMYNFGYYGPEDLIFKQHNALDIINPEWGESSFFYMAAPDWANDWYSHFVTSDGSEKYCLRSNSNDIGWSRTFCIYDSFDGIFTILNSSDAGSNNALARIDTWIVRNWSMNNETVGIYNESVPQTSETISYLNATSWIAGHYNETTVEKDNLNFGIINIKEQNRTSGCSIGQNRPIYGQKGDYFHIGYPYLLSEDNENYRWLVTVQNDTEAAGYKRYFEIIQNMSEVMNTHLIGKWISSKNISSGNGGGGNGGDGDYHLYLNGIAANRTYEDGSIITITISAPEDEKSNITIDAVGFRNGFSEYGSFSRNITSFASNIYFSDGSTEKTIDVSSYDRSKFNITLHNQSEPYYFILTVNGTTGSPKNINFSINHTLLFEFLGNINNTNPYINQFNDSSTVYNLNFSAAGSELVYILVPKNVSFSYANMTLDSKGNGTNYNNKINGTSSARVYYNRTQNISMYVEVPKGSTIISAEFNISGLQVQPKHGNLSTTGNGYTFYDAITSNGVHNGHLTEWDWYTNSTTNLNEYYWWRGDSPTRLHCRSGGSYGDYEHAWCKGAHELNLNTSNTFDDITIDYHILCYAQTGQWSYINITASTDNKTWTLLDELMCNPGDKSKQVNGTPVTICNGHSVCYIRFESENYGGHEVWSTIYEVNGQYALRTKGTADYNNYPFDPFIETFDKGLPYDWNYTGAFENNITQKVVLNISRMQDYVDNNCTESLCRIPIKAGAEIGGILNLSNATISYSDSISNLQVDTGDDGIIDWNWTGYFNKSIAPVGISLNPNAINDYIRSDSCAGNTSCLLPVKFMSESSGGMNLSHMTLRYSSENVPINTDVLQNYLLDCRTNCEIPLNFTGTGNIKVTYGTKFYGTSSHKVEARADGYYRNLNFTVYFSKFNKTSAFDWFDIVPKNLSSKNVTPYKQTNSTPFWNITMLGYGKDANFSFYINQTNSSRGGCINITLSTTNNVSEGQIIHPLNKWFTLNTSVSQYDSFGVWAWVDFNSCTRDDYMLWNPEFYFRACCEGCICSEEI